MLKPLFPPGGLENAPLSRVLWTGYSGIHHNLDDISHTIHVTFVFTYTSLLLEFQPNVCKYASPMNPMGINLVDT